MESLELALSQNFRSVDYFMELHREIERLKTEKLILLRYNFENQEKFEEMKKKQEELEKAKSLKDLVLTLNIIDMLSFILKMKLPQTFYHRQSKMQNGK